MYVSSIQQSTSFKNACVAAASFLEENVMLNKALLDASVDIPFVCLSNNKIEQKERLRRVSVNYILCFLSPFLTLPLTNKFAMKHIAKLTPKFNSKESNLIQLSNKFLKNKNLTKDGVKLLSKEKQTDYSKIIENCGGDYEVLRKKLINAKNAVLSFDFLFSSSSIIGMTLLNNSITRKTTNMEGYSAEFELTDKETIEKRAEEYKKTEPLRKGITAALVASVTALPLAIKKGLESVKESYIPGFIKKYADKFDYTNGIFMKRLPLFLFTGVAQTGIILASRNKTELKNNFLIGSTGMVIYFGGDLLINSLLSQLSDKFLKTNIIDKNAPKTFINKIIPPTIPIKNLTGKSQKIAAINFFINIASLAFTYGYGVPHLMNKIVRKDLQKEIK
ncbi:MAG: hypothetical protein MJ237_08885 [bacterium]|nr:hypothetical protein [bacterium]